jgi:4'-phosphopantetheinyl transferase
MENNSPAAPVLSSDEVHVWKVSARSLSTTAEWELLSHDERHRALALRSTTDRIRWIRAHAALRDILRKYVPDAPPLRFRVGKFGKPELDESLGLRFNLAHSGQWALIAVARDREVGVDVEEVCLEDLEPIVHTAFSPTERLAFGRLTGEARVDAFYRCWTRKEAIVKGLGLGLHAELTELEVPVERQDRPLLLVPPPAFASKAWILDDITLDSRHMAAVAVEGAAPALCRVLEWTFPLDRPSGSAFSSVFGAIVRL